MPRESASRARSDGIEAKSSATAPVKTRRARNEVAAQKSGAPAWDREPREARSIASVVFTPARGVIHPSFPLRGRWERSAKNSKQAPSPSLTAFYTSSCKTRLLTVLLHPCRHRRGWRIFAQAACYLQLERSQQRCALSRIGFSNRYGTIPWESADCGSGHRVLER
jgi:hypothetical protein